MLGCPRRSALLSQGSREYISCLVPKPELHNSIASWFAELGSNFHLFELYALPVLQTFHLGPILHSISIIPKWIVPSCAMNFIHYILFSLLPTPISSRFLIFLILFTLSKRYQILSHKENRRANGWHVSLLVLLHHKNVLALCSPFSFLQWKCKRWPSSCLRLLFLCLLNDYFYCCFPQIIQFSLHHLLNLSIFPPWGLKISTFIIY